jgi:hypothetical protein
MGRKRAARERKDFLIAQCSMNMIVNEINFVERERTQCDGEPRYADLLGYLTEPLSQWGKEM